MTPDEEHAALLALPEPLSNLIRFHESRKPRDLWEWMAEYRDGTLLHEYDDDGQSRGFGNLDQAQVIAVTLIPRATGFPFHQLQLDDITGRKRSIFFRRRSRSMDIATGDFQGESAIHVLGWQDTFKKRKNGRNIASYTFFLPNGSVVVSDDREALPTA